MTTRRRTATTRTCYSGVSYSITFHTFDNLEFTLDAKYRVTNSLFRAYVTSTAALNRGVVPDHFCHPVFPPFSSWLLYDGYNYNGDQADRLRNMYLGWGENFCESFGSDFSAVASSARFVGPPDGYK